MTIPIDVRGILGSWDVLTADHDPDGWPAVRMRELTTICAHLLSQDAENAQHIKMLAECFRMAGADPDGNEDWRIAPDALRAVTDLRRDYDEVLDWQARCGKAESRLAAANALLREALSWTLKYPEAGTWGATTLCRKLQSHLQGAGDE